MLLHCSWPAIATSRTATPRIELLLTAGDDDAAAGSVSTAWWFTVAQNGAFQLDRNMDENGRERENGQAGHAGKRWQEKEKTERRVKGKKAGKHQDRIHKAITEGRK